MAAIGTPERRANAEALLGEVESDASVATDAIELTPDDVRQVDATLHDQVFHQPAEIIDRQRSNDRRALAPALAHRARYVVFATAFPHLEAAGIAHAAESRIEPQHHFAEGRAVPARVAGRSDLEHVIGHALLPANGLDELNCACALSVRAPRSPASPAPAC